MSARIYVAIPAMDEEESLPKTLLDLSSQHCNTAFEVHICVNHPENYWNTPEKRRICESNSRLLRYLHSDAPLPIHILDCASRGKGWQDKKGGVGMARKMLSDNIMAQAAPDDILVSLDADTRVPDGYLQAIADFFDKHPGMAAVALPYYHPLGDDERQNRAILRYELYMRNYAINLMEIGSPFSFTALGSAIAVRLGALRKIGGFTPLKSGEDFYLLQKLRKMSVIGLYCDTCVKPSPRYSSRVVFGTGPALLKGCTGEWSGCPIYPRTAFYAIAETYRQLPELYDHNLDNSFLHFLEQQFGQRNLWQPIRDNVKDLPHFVHAFHEKADGLRILQYLRSICRQNEMENGKALNENIRHWLPDASLPDWENEPLFGESAETLDTLRNLLFQYEMRLRKNITEQPF